MIRVAFGSVPKDGGTFTFYRNMRPEFLRHGVDMRCVSVGLDQAEITEAAFVDQGCVELAADTRDLRTQARVFAEWCEDQEIDIVIGVNSPAILSSLPHLPEKVRVVARCANGFEEGYRLSLIGRDRVARFVALVPRLQGDLINDYGVDSDKIVLIPNGAVTDRFADAAGRINSAVEPLSLGFLGRLEHGQKGVMYIPSVLDRLDAAGVSYHLRIAGKGKHEEDLRAALATRVEDGRVRFVGTLSPEEIPEFLAYTHLFLFTSHFEGCPNALLEAMAAGAVPVSWRLHGITDFLLEDGRTGLLCDTGDTGAFATAIASLAGDRARLKDMSLAVAEAARQKYSTKACAASYKKLFDDVIAEPPPTWSPVPWSKFEPDPVFRQRLMSRLLPKRHRKIIRDIATRLEGNKAAPTAPAIANVNPPTTKQEGLRVHQIINSVDLSRGGAERVARQIHAGLRKSGFDAKLVALEDCDMGDLEGACSLGLSSPYDPRALLRLKAYARGIAANDIVHVHLFPSSAHVAALARTGHLPGRLVFTEHSTSNRRRGHVLGGLIDEKVYRSYEKIIAISDGVKAELLRTHPWLVNRTTVIENGCPLFFDHLPDRTGLDGPFHIVSVGRLTPAKNYDTAVHALAQLPAGVVRYSIAGEGAERATLERLTSELGLKDRVNLLGYVENVSELLKTADAFLIPSNWEGFGLAAVEAMNAGLPVIAADVPGLREVVGRDGHAARLVDPSDVAGIASAVRFLAENPDERRRMGAAGFEMAKKYDMVRFLEAHKSFYEKLGVRPSDVA